MLINPDIFTQFLITSRPYWRQYISGLKDSMSETQKYQQSQDNNKHVIIFTSTAHIVGYLYVGNETKTFLKDVEMYLNKAIQSSKIEKMLVMDWEELQKELGMDGYSRFLGHI